MHECGIVTGSAPIRRWRTGVAAFLTRISFGLGKSAGLMRVLERPINVKRCVVWLGVSRLGSKKALLSIAGCLVWKKKASCRSHLDI